MDGLIRFIYCADGDVFGGYVRDILAGGPSEVKDLDCRIDPEKCGVFMNFVSLDYDVTINVTGANYRSMGVVSYSLRPKGLRDDASVFKMDVLLCHSNKWSGYPGDFDVNQLVKNNNGTYVRPLVSLGLLHAMCRFDTIVERCVARKFALISLPSNVFLDILTLLIRANDMVHRGWIMDDMYLGRRSWIINKWSVICDDTEGVRTKYSESAIAALKCQSECSLCQEAFGPDDVVINTCCNHNFHWTCSQENSGLLYWYRLKQSFLCPYCRQHSVHYILPYTPTAIAGTAAASISSVATA